MARYSRQEIEAAVAKSEQILAGAKPIPPDVLNLVKVLHAERRFGLARKVLTRYSADTRVRGDPRLRLEFAQKRALSTYKDPDLQADEKFDDALSILQEADDLATSTNQETLGQAGAICKRKWELTSQERHLITSLSYYLRGTARGIASDYGYTAINAAFVLDLIADLEEPHHQGTDPDRAARKARRDRAAAIRREIVGVLPGLPDKEEWLANTWWFLVTLGEAYFGLRDYDSSQVWLMRAAKLDVPDWERESTARQLAALLRLQEQADARTGAAMNDAARKLLQQFLGGSYAAATSVIRGKVGLALSGGGFRASLYHIGMLAKLAEVDVLRHVEYLSCVSGGSIIGAHYYLEVRKLLREKSDEEVKREDYVEIVRRIARDFAKGVEENVRTRILAEWSTNLRMIFSPNYSRTMRAGDLYEKCIYARVRDGEGGTERWLNELKIVPKGEDSGFMPKDHNWRRSAKVPMLILNATTLNTGHNWQFTASWMGEPPASINSEIDANYRMRRLYYEQAPKPHQRVRLGHAVAASACVPGIFEPLPLPDLYERLPAEGERKVRPIVRLVDGGVHDNQGVASLLEQGVSVLLVSDASGQMEVQDMPSSAIVGVPLRANSILQARVRVSQFQDLSSRKNGGLLKGLMFVHLKKDLETAPVDWIDTQDPSEPLRADPLTSYGVQKHVQRRLATIRTDLDSFSECEASALMADAYLMTEAALHDDVLGFPVDVATREPWDFLAIEPLLGQPGTENPLIAQLAVADRLFFKVWKLVRPLQIAAGVLAVLVLAIAVYAAWRWWTTTIFSVTLGGVVVALVCALLTMAGLAIVSRVLNYRKTAQDILVGIGMAFVGALIARLHLHVFDRLFLRQGRLDRLLARAANRHPTNQTPAAAA